MLVFENPEVTTFNPRIHHDEFLRRSGLVAVGSAYLTSVIFPGMQPRVAIGADNVPRLGETGLTRAQRSLRLAAGDVVNDFAYTSGFRPGFAGMTGDRSVPRSTEIMMAQAVKERMIADAGNYAGYLLLAEAARFGESTESHAPATRDFVPVSGIVGLRLADVDILMGQRGIDGLRDPVDVPRVREQFKTHNLRPEAFAA